MSKTTKKKLGNNIDTNCNNNKCQTNEKKGNEQKKKMRPELMERYAKCGKWQVPGDVNKLCKILKTCMIDVYLQQQNTVNNNNCWLARPQSNPKVGKNLRHSL